MIAEFFPNFIIFSFFLLVSIGSYAQEQKNFSVEGMTGGTQKIELSDPEAIKDLKNYIDKEKNLITERRKCKENKDEKQERQKCLCDRGKDYADFNELIMQTLLKHQSWDMTVLTWQEEGKIKKRRFGLFNPIYNEFENKCWREANRTYTAIYDYELPGIKVTDPSSVKELAQLNRYMEKAGKFEPACPWDDEKTAHVNERDVCVCKNMDKYKYLKTMVNAAIKKHPDWQTNTISFTVGRFWHSGVSLLNIRRTMQRYIDRCELR